MNTKPGYHIVIDHNTHRHMVVKSLLAALLFTTSIDMLASSIAKAVAGSTIIDERIEQACNWPKQEGEMTVVTVYQRKLVCWNFY